MVVAKVDIVTTVVAKIEKGIWSIDHQVGEKINQVDISNQGRK